MGLFLTISTYIKPIDIFVVSLLTIFLYVLHFYYKHFTRINPLPGPLPIPLIGSFSIFKGDIDAWFWDLNKKYGENGVFELNITGNRQIVLTRADYVDKFLSITADKYYARTDNNGLLSFFDLDKKGVVFNHDRASWKFNRAVFSQSFAPLASSTKPSKYANELFEELSGCWTDLKPKGDDSMVVDIALWFRRFVCDYMSLLLTEKSTSTIRNYYRKSKKNEAITREIIESEEFVECIRVFTSDNHMIFAPKIVKSLPLLEDRIKKLLNNSNLFYKKLENVVKQRRKEIKKLVDNDIFETKELDPLSALIVTNTQYDARPPKNIDPSFKRPMTDEEIRGIMFDTYTAGTDTSVNMLCYAIYYVSHHPEVKKKLIKEIDSIFSDDPTRQATMKDHEKLKYCEAVIKEAARIRPSINILTRYTDEYDEVAGYKWPNGMLYLIYIRGIHNNPLYWKDPEKFIPERFYEPESIKNQHKNSFIPFGGGPKLCPGKRIAMIEIKLFLALLYRKYDVRLEDMNAPLNVMTSSITICTELKMKLIPRELKTCS